MELKPGLRVVVPLAHTVREWQGQEPIYTTATVVAAAPEYGEQMWWTEMDMPGTGGALSQLYNASEILGQYVGP